MKSIYLGACSIMFIGQAIAQTAAPSVAPSPSVAVQPSVIQQPATAPSYLRVGTPVALKMGEELTTKNKVARVGQRFRLEVSENVLVNNQVVIPAGTPAVGEVTDVRNKGMWGKSGHISAQLRYLQVGGRQIRLSGSFDDKGVTGTAGVVAAIAFVPVAGFFTTGTSAKIPVGAGVKGFIDEDVPLAVASTSPEPLPVVPASQPLAAPATTAAH